MAADLRKIREFFTAPLCPPVILQISSAYLSGIHIDLKESRVKSHSVLGLPAGVLEPHFDRKNIKDSAALSAVLKDCLRELQWAGKKIACLVPEPCLRLFVMSFDSLPAAESEREKIILWRAKKLLAVLPEDVRLAYEAVPSGSSVKVVAALARGPVVREFEDWLAGQGLEVGVIASPMISLLNLLDWEKEKDLLLANIEEDSLGLVAITQSEPVLYRLKTFSTGPDAGLRSSQKIEAVVKEIENTVHFIEDREKREIRSLYFRSGLRDGREDILDRLRTRLRMEPQPIEAPSACGLSPELGAFLAPLAGQVPWRNRMT